MKKLILTVTAIIIAGNLFAQLPADYNIEMGLSGGIGPNTLPRGANKLYEGNKSMLNFAGAFRIHYNASEYWQVGGEVGVTRWQSSGTTALTDVYGQNLQPQKVTFVIADPAISVCAQVNRMMPFYSKYKEYNKANFYYGVSAGIISTINDGSITYKKYDASAGNGITPGYTYPSQYNYGYGIGYTGGVQVGFEYFIINQLGIDLELQGRYTYIGTNDTRYNHENAQYHLFYFPIMAGIRYRF